MALHTPPFVGLRRMNVHVTRRREGFFDRPTTLNSAIQGSQIDHTALVSAPISQRLLLAECFKDPIGAQVIRLPLRGRPSTIRWFVVAVAVDAVDRLLNPGQSHVVPVLNCPRPERDIRRGPLGTDLNAAPSVARVTLDCRVGATRLHCAPYVVQPLLPTAFVRARMPVQRSILADPIATVASARQAFPAAQPAFRQHALGSTFASDEIRSRCRGREPDVLLLSDYRPLSDTVADREVWGSERLATIMVVCHTRILPHMRESA